ncbi:MAG: metallophosphoesterase, partial [bacterium]
MTQQQKIFAVGDIHGNFEKLSRLIPRLPFDRARGDTLVFMGDYINRGPQTADVIAYLIELKQRLTKVVFLMGNHEHTLLMYAKTGEEGLLQLLRHMKVEETLNS